MAATRALADASLLTGLWGISGNASSRFEVAAHSEGIPQAGDLTANVAFKVAKKELSFSLNGRHQTILNGSGLTAEGEFASTPLEANLSQRVTLLSLVPGANAAVSALGPFGQRLVGGAGAFVEAGVSGSASGTYEALPGDADPRFTSGTLEVGAYIKAQVNPVPKFARGVVNLEISGGGGAAMVINLAPNPSVASLTGFLNFALKASIFNLEAETDKTWTFGDPLPLAPAKAPKEKAAARGQAGAKAAADTLMPPGTQPDIAFGPFGPNPRMIFYAEPHPTLPAPATRIVVHYRDFDGLPWQRRTTAEAGGKANFAPVFAQPLSTPSIGTGGNFSRGVAVWVQATGAAPATTGDLAAYMNTTELRFDYYNTSSFGGGFDGTERELTSNAVADFGPSLVNCRSNSDVRLFWVRGEGMDLTGSTTPLQILTRSWTTYHPGAPANDPSTAWSAEATASSGLTHIVDWTAAAWDTENAAIAIVADMDGDLATLDDTELWLARETAGTWAAPVRLTTNAVADEAPVLLFKSATSLALGWRQGDTVVGTFDYDAAPAPATWFDAASGVADEWGGAKLDYRASEDSLVLLWSRGTGIAYTEQAYAAPDAGSAWPAPRFHDFGSGVVAEFATKFDANSDPGEGTCYLTAVVENASDADLNTVPVHENACILTAELAFGPDARTTRLVEAYSSIASPQVGDDLLFGVRAESPNPLTYTWSRDGEDLSHFTGPELTLHDLTFDDEGTYVVTISDGASLVQQPFDLAFPMTYATWIARRVPGGGADLGPQDDRDRDGCQNVLEYLFDTDPEDPGERPRGELTASGIEDTGDISFLINRRATDLTYAIEFSTDFQTWTDVTASFATFPISGGIDARHLFAPFNAESFNSFENFGEFPVPVEAGGSFRVRILSLD
ncbi:MAG: immunoglobulin domain-containing protein [Verrucomicrobiales bacterium]